MADMSLLRPFPGEATVEELYDRMFTVTSRLRLTVSKEDDGVAVICIIDHPAVKDFQAQKYLEVQCESSQDRKKTFSCKIACPSHLHVAVNLTDVVNELKTFCYTIRQLIKKLMPNICFTRIVHPKLKMIQPHVTFGICFH